MSRTRSEPAQVDLFPFTAVLLSAMGALVLLLFGLLSEAAADVAAPPAAADRAHVDVAALEVNLGWWDDRLPRDRAELELRRSRHEDFEAETALRIAQARDQEERLAIQRALRERPWVVVEQLQRRLADLGRLEGEAGTQLQARRETVTELEERARQREDELERLELESSARQRRVPVVWRGSSRTNLEPVFFDCTGGSLQEIGGARFDLGVDESDLTAVDRDFMKHVQRLQRENRYAVFVVRPSGIDHYILAALLCRKAKTAYGYVVVEDDVVLEFPEEAGGEENR